jgi:sugar-specific transcriptional regulator TrmB
MEYQRIKLLMGNLGFSEWETSAYWILVRYGAQTAVGLSRLSKIARPKTYEVITRLRKKGLVMKIPPMPTKGVTQKFVALDPKKTFLSKINDMRELSNSLEEMYKNPIEPAFPKINMYTSKEAVQELLYDVAKNSKYFYIYFSDLNLSSLLKYSFEHILNIIKKKRHYFLLRESEELKQFSKNIKNYSFIKNKENMGYIIASDRVLLDLYATQHVILEIISDEAVKTFLDLYFSKIKSPI